VTFAPLADGPDRLAVVASQKPNQMAIVDDRPDGSIRSLDYAELNDLVNRIAHGLVGSGFKPGERLLWAGRDSIEAILIQHAVRKVGGYSVALNHRLQREEVYGIARVAEATFAWAEASFRDVFAEADLPSMRQVVIFDGEPAKGQVSMDDFIAGCSADEPPPRAASERAFDPILSFTAGTTGRPKGVVRYTLGPAEARMQSELIGNGDGAFIVTGSLSHSGPNGMANNALLLGATVVLQRRFDAEDWMRLVDKYRVTNSYSAPYPVRHISQLPAEVASGYDTSCFTTMIAAAAQWPFELKEAFLAAFPGCSVWELYGSTELASITVMRPEEQLARPGSCGRLVEGVEVELVDEAGKVVTEPGVPGVLYAKSESVAADYLGDHDAFLEASRGDFLTAGDVAYFDEDGFFFIVDRTKDMVISAGVNIYPREVENALESHPGVFESAVVGLPDEEWGERLHAVVVAARGEKPTEEELIAHCREHLATHKVPRAFEFVDELPHLLSGKVAKREVRERILAEATQ
jgi:fatty-acyl-CoA synthase/long-chain acyl-CoA synthetase